MRRINILHLKIFILFISADLKNSQIEFDIYFTYKNVHNDDDFTLNDNKIIYYLLKIKNNLVIMKKETLGIIVSILYITHNNSYMYFYKSYFIII